MKTLDLQYTMIQFFYNGEYSPRRSRGEYSPIFTSLRRIIVLLKTPPKYRKLDHNKNKKAQKNHAYALHFCTSWYNGSYTMLYNNSSYSHILIGSRLWSIRGQMLDWRHRYKVFFSPCFKMAESFENFDNILRDCAKGKAQKGLAKTLNRFQIQEEER